MATTAPPSLSKGKGPIQGGRQLGTLVVVVYRARNLPNKQRIGKQDPYCACTVGHQKHRTAAIKRGGQTPRWDAQLQFEIWEDAENEVKAVATESGGIAPAPNTPVRAILEAGGSDGKENEPPGQANVGRTANSTAGTGGAPSSSSSSKRNLKVACYADDLKEPELIGEGVVDFTSILKKGEYDEWVKLEHKGKYSGEVFIEMTFYSSGPPPIRRPRKQADAASGYGGPGYFEPLPSNFLQSPPQIQSLRERPTGPSLSPGPSASPSLRTSQSAHTLHPSNTPALSEFGARHPSLPMPNHSHNLHDSLSSTHPAAYMPPYAPPSLAHSQSSTNLRSHRASMSSYGMTQHDTDSLIRPLSSLSISNISKPLPTPHSGPSRVISETPLGPPYHRQASPYRPHSGQGGNLNQMPPVHPIYDPHLHHPPPFEHHANSNPVSHLQQSLYEEPRPDFPKEPHRHSLSTYIPQEIGNERAYSKWNRGQVPVQLAGQEKIPAHQGFGVRQEPFRSSPSANLYESRTGGEVEGWQDPRRSLSSFAQTSPMHGSPHPPSLQAGPSNGYLHNNTPNNQSAHLAPSAFQPPPPHQEQHWAEENEWSHIQQLHRQQPAFDDVLAPSAQFDQQQQPHLQNAYGGMSDYPGSHDGHDQVYSHDQHAYYQHAREPCEDFSYQQQQSNRDHYQQQEEYPQHHEPYPQRSSAIPFFEHTGHSALHSHSPSPSPRPPLPQPIPESWQHRQEQPDAYYRDASHRVHSPYPSYQAAYQPSISEQHGDGLYQPRFGLPPHQPYDPPYQPQYSQRPPVPPIPNELRMEQRRQNYGY